MDDVDKRVRGADGRTYPSIRHFNGSSRDEQLDRSGLRDVRITAFFYSFPRFGFGFLSPGVSSSHPFPLPLFHPSYPDPSFLRTSISLSPTPSLDLVVALWFSVRTCLLVCGFGSLALSVVLERKTPDPRPSKYSTLGRLLLSR